MLLDRSEIINALFRETDRAQRMKTPLALIQIGIDDCSDGYSQPEEIVERIIQLLRSYDLIGAVGRAVFLAVLPGCDGTDAILLAERLKREVFCVPARTGARTGPDACFGVVSSGGRSPMVVMREAELALQRARTDGPGSVECSEPAGADPSAYFCPGLPLETLRR